MKVLMDGYVISTKNADVIVAYYYLTLQVQLIQLRHSQNMVH